MSDTSSPGWFGDEPEPVDPTKSARQGARASLPKRFYETAAVTPEEGGFVLTLDGRPARTPARKPLSFPTRALGEAVAAEWQAQGPSIDPATMPLTRLANSAIDGVADQREAVIDDLVKYAGSDLVCYRAGEPERLVAEQAGAWDPILAALRDGVGAQFVLSQGVTFVEQPESATAAVRAWIEREPSAFRLAGLHVMTTLTGSVLIAIALALGRLDPQAAWDAAHADELYQESVWGKDAQAMARREARYADFLAAARTYELAGPEA
ncbi:ATP12 family chaperone protein [Salinarimonas soli]|uniref:ATPase n=1 Tax=Salinarimonas soli TaxID=1638099 RepID=A0A5B2V7Q1_9HYPH|nr:ATP12 family protein [Salinarimonas soli]KAA2234605.1 ATPase [Salinarimonas soli]